MKIGGDFRKLYKLVEACRHRQIDKRPSFARQLKLESIRSSINQARRPTFNSPEMSAIPSYQQAAAPLLPAILSSRRTFLL